jgi:hypothetical protein
MPLSGDLAKQALLQKHSNESGDVSNGAHLSKDDVEGFFFVLERCNHNVVTYDCYVLLLPNCKMTHECYCNPFGSPAGPKQTIVDVGIVILAVWFCCRFLDR